MDRHKTEQGKATAFRNVVTALTNPKRRKYTWCWCQIHTRTANVAPNAGKSPRMAYSSAVLPGTSVETTSRARAKAKTASLNPSKRETSPPRLRNPVDSTVIPGLVSDLSISDLPVSNVSTSPDLGKHSRPSELRKEVRSALSRCDWLKNSNEKLSTETGQCQSR